MSSVVSRLAVIVALLFLYCAANVNADKNWIQLFNGRDLSGRTPKIVGHKAGDKFADTFRVEDGLLKVRYDKYNGDFQGRFGHLFYERSFLHY